MSKTSQFGERIRSLLQAKGWSQAEVGRRSGIAPAVLSRVLAGERPATMDHVASLARALDTDPEDLITGTEAAHVLTEWVPRSTLEAAERVRVAEKEEFLQLRTELEVQIRQNALLLRSLNEARAQIEDLRGRLGTAASQERLEIESLRGELESHQLREQVLQEQLALANRQIAEDEAWRTETSARITTLQGLLKQSGNDKVAIGLAGAGLGALIAVRPPIRGPWRPSRRRTGW